MQSYLKPKGGAEATSEGRDSPASLLELALINLRFGLTAFGGPAAHIALMHREFVKQRQWLSEAEFIDLLGAVNLIPGPASTQLAIFIGKRRAGVSGLIVAGVCFILPAALIVSGFAWAYRVYGSSPNAERLMYGVKPVIIAVIAQATWILLRATVKDRLVGAVGLIAVALSLASLPPLAIVFGSGCSTALVRWVQQRKESVRPLLGILGLVASFVVFAGILGRQEFGRVPFGIGALFLFFLKVGSVLYGSGYSLLAYLNQDLVSKWQWLTQGQLLDAVAVGQFTPGPVFTTATFIGLYLGGPVGAVAATVGIFLPSFFFVGLSARFLPRATESMIVRAFMNGVNVASLAIMAVVAVKLGEAALKDWLTVSITIVSFLILVRLKVNSAWLMAGGAILGLCAGLFGWKYS